MHKALQEDANDHVGEEKREEILLKDNIKNVQPKLVFKSKLGLENFLLAEKQTYEVGSPSPPGFQSTENGQRGRCSSSPLHQHSLGRSLTRQIWESSHNMWTGISKASK